MTHDRPFTIGLQLPEVEREVHWPEIRTMAETAETVGFDALWVGDHLLYRKPGGVTVGPWESWSLLAALAAVTSTVDLGHLVASTSFHNPAIIAKKAMTIDDISGGRFILGLGAGWNKDEYSSFGFPYDHRVVRFEEAFTIIRRLLAETEVSFDGDYTHLERCQITPRGPRPQGPPLMIGSTGERMLGITLPHVDSWNVWYADIGNSPAGFAEANERVTRIANEVGRDPESIERTVAVLVGVTGSTGRDSVYTDGQPVLPITGSSNEIADALWSFHESGADHVQIVLDPITVGAIEEVGPSIRLVRERQKR